MTWNWVLVGQNEKRSAPVIRPRRSRLALNRLRRNASERDNHCPRYVFFPEILAAVASALGCASSPVQFLLPRDRTTFRLKTHGAPAESLCNVPQRPARRSMRDAHSPLGVPLACWNKRGNCRRIQCADSIHVSGRHRRCECRRRAGSCHPIPRSFGSSPALSSRTLYPSDR